MTKPFKGRKAAILAQRVRCVTGGKDISGVSPSVIADFDFILLIGGSFPSIYCKGIID